MRFRCASDAEKAAFLRCTFWLAGPGPLLVFRRFESSANELESYGPHFLGV